ncbi:MAG: anti-sigma factor family protein [Kiloniellaceae bacterium]
MADRDLSFELLNAYVDGELAADDAAFVARRAAEDPRIARRLAALQELRAGVAGLAADVVMLPECGTAAPARHPLRRRLGALSAAAALLAVMLGTGWWALEQDAPQQAQGEAALVQLVERHSLWRRSAGEHRMPADVAAPRTTALMAATGLRLVHEETLVLTDGTAVRHSGYLGANGCRLSLFELPHTRPDSATGMLEVSQRDDLLTAIWQGRDRRYVMVARNMDNVRFATIASSIKAATEAVPADEADLIAALEGARQRCLA